MSAESAVVRFGFMNHKEFLSSRNLKKKHKAECRFCHVVITETSGTTSNFHRHIQRKHPERLLEYKAGQGKTDAIQPTVTTCSPKISVLYGPQSRKQQVINQAIIQDLIIGCSLPLSIVENEHFKKFLKVMDFKYTPISRTISEKQIPVLVGKVKQTIVERLESQSSVSVTVDIWSDRRRRSFLGVTAHAVCSSDASYALTPYLLECRCFAGRHNGERIAAAFEEIIEEYGISQKISYVITDNAANMKRAFKIQMPQQQADDTESEEEPLDDERLWEDVDSDDTELLRSTGERLSCFAHSLQLVISDGMKEVKSIGPAIAKTSRFTALLHSSSQFKGKFEAIYGAAERVPAANTKRWNSTFKQVQALTALDLKKLTEMCVVDFADVVFSPREWSQLKDLAAVLAPFAEATDLTDGEKHATISVVVPTVLDLNTHLLKMEETHTQCRPLVRALRESLRKRFMGIFVYINMAEMTGKEEPFNHNIYFLATMLDPQFGLSWVDLDVTCNGGAVFQKKYREELKKTLTDTLIAEVVVENITEIYGEPGDSGAAVKQEDSGATLKQEESGVTLNQEDDSPPRKCARMLSRYKSHKKRRPVQHTSIVVQVTKYFDTIQDIDKDNALDFWATYQALFPQIYILAMKVLSVPASSAPVETVFSRGGLVTRSHSASLSQETLSSLVFLKCNCALLQS